MTGTYVSFDFTHPVRASFCNVIVPTAYKDKKTGKLADPKYGAQLIMAPDHPDVKALKEAMLQAAQLSWPSRNIREALGEKTLRMPLLTGEGLIARRTADLKKEGKPYDEKLDYLKGFLVLRSTSKQMPNLAFLEKGRILDVTTEAQIAQNKGKFYSGVECLVSLNFNGYDAKAGSSEDGLSTYLQAFCSLNKGERMAGGGAPASERFKGYVGKVTAEDPTEGFDPDDEIPF